MFYFNFYYLCVQKGKIRQDEKAQGSLRIPRNYALFT